MTNILVLGEGAREHCIAEFLEKSPSIEKVYVFPGNDGMVSKNIINADFNNNFENILGFCIFKEIKYVFPAKESYLVDGVVDFLERKGISCFGPNKKNSLIEGCKIFSKNLMKEYNILTPEFSIFDNIIDAQNYIFDNNERTFVIKNPNLAGGKGVYLPSDVPESLEILKILFEKNKEVIIEEKIYGKEVSILGFCNGKEAELMPQAQDYKKLYDDDLGPNTGGMGACSPVEVLDSEELSIIKNHMDKIVKDLNYKGVLYAGIMKTSKGIYVLEFNCRFGDPEAQVILNLLESDFFDVVKKCIEGQKVVAEWKKGSALNLVLSHQDYPYKKLDEFIKIDLGVLDPALKLYSGNLDPALKLYSGNLQKYRGDFFSKGGRILSLTKYSESPCENYKTIYENARKIKYENKYYRMDIGSELVKEKIGKKLKIAILGSTKGTSINKILSEREKLNISIEIIISNKSDSQLLEKAKRENISFFYLDPSKYNNREEYDKKLVNILKLFDIDLIILDGYMKILTKKIIESYETKIINIHPSILPSYSGLMDKDVHKKVLKTNEKFSGCTVHYVSEEVDGGEIISQKQYCIKKNESTESLKSEIQKLESEALIEAINIFRERKIDYNFTGVSIEEGNKIVDMIKNLTPQLKKDIGHFGCIYEIGDTKLAASVDGVGSKLELAIEENSYNTIGIDLVAMVVNDLYCCGAKPLFFLDYLAVDKIDKEKCKSIIEGINRGCEISDCKLIGGETAEMPSLYPKDKFDLAGFGVGVVTDTLPKKINKDDIIYGLKSSGIHSNGYSLVRKLLKTSSYSMKEILKPTRIYNEIPGIQKKYGENLLGVCHITGGGISENLPRILPANLTFEIINWEFPPIFKWIQTESKMSDEEMKRVFNCGYGMLFVFKKDTQISEEEFEYLGKII